MVPKVFFPPTKPFIILPVAQLTAGKGLTLRKFTEVFLELGHALSLALALHCAGLLPRGAALAAHAIPEEAVRLGAPMIHQVGERHGDDWQSFENIAVLLG